MAQKKRLNVLYTFTVKNPPPVRAAARVILGSIWRVPPLTNWFGELDGAAAAAMGVLESPGVPQGRDRSRFSIWSHTPP